MLVTGSMVIGCALEIVMLERRMSIRDTLLSRAKREPIIMGILNVTPDSFSDGGQYLEPQQAVHRALEMRAEGADILDIGGESTRPGSTPVSMPDELARVGSVIAAVCDACATPVSIDTYKAAVARAAARAGAVLINDVWGMTRDRDMAQAVAETECAVVVTYNRGQIDATITLVDDMRVFFDRSLEIADAAGIPRNHIILDPGLGFSKTFEQNFEAIARLDTLKGCRSLLAFQGNPSLGDCSTGPLKIGLRGRLPPTSPLYRPAPRSFASTT